MTTHQDEIAPQTDAGSGNKVISIPIYVDAKSSEAENDNDDVEEWAMLELNGELIAPTVVPSAADAKESEHYQLLGTDGIELGSLQFRNKTTPILIVGGHELKGSIQKLPLPFGVLERVVQEQNINQDDANQEEPAVSYRLVGIVKQKILFQSYPKSIVR